MTASYNGSDVYECPSCGNVCDRCAYQCGHPHGRPSTTELAKKLDQRRFTHMSDRMAHVVRSILDGHLTITSDGFVLAGAFSNEFIGEIGDLERNWNALLDAAQLDDKERTLANELYRKSITDWRR